MKTLIFYLVLVCLSCNASGQGIYHLWGQQQRGGSGYSGSVFSAGYKGNYYTDKFQPATTNHGPDAGENPLTEWSGRYFGVARGGLGEAGIIFEYNTALNTYTIIKHLGSIGAKDPSGGLELAGDKLYGVTSSGGSNNDGTIFELDLLTMTAVVKVSFASGGGQLYGPNYITRHSNGKMYGFAYFGGLQGIGGIFEWDMLANTVTTKSSFSAPTGSYPAEALVEYAGKLWGISNSGGANNYGAIFSYDPALNIYNKEFDFSAATGFPSSSFNSGLLLEYNNKLYGTLYSGGANSAGVLFEWDPATAVYTRKHDFSAVVNGTGRNPRAGLSLHNNKFYGTTSGGGANSLGVIFEWDPAVSLYNQKYSFSFAAGTQGSFLNQKGSSFLGITYGGGTGFSAVSIGRGGGVIFEWDPAGNVFDKKMDMNLTPAEGCFPYGALVSYGGKLYGLMTYGGKNYEGTIVEIDPVSNSLTKRIDFNDYGCKNPFGSLTLFNNKFYGTTRNGGVNNRGVLFEWDPATNIFIKKYDLGSVNDGSSPQGSLTLYNNKLYGTTQLRGAFNSGTLFEWDPVSNIFIKRHDFTNATGSFGGIGNTTLVVLNNKLYASTSDGGANGFGVLFEWDPSLNLYTNKLDLEYTTTGAYIFGGLMAALNGKLYGTFTEGGNNGNGVLFEWDPATNIYTKKHEFADPITGSYPVGTVSAAGGKIYGMTTVGGDNGWGTLFEWDPVSNSYTVKKQLDIYSGHSAISENAITPHPATVSDGVPGSCVSFPSVTIDNTNNNEWVAIVDNGGNAVAEIKANGNNLGVVNVQAFVHNGTIREDFSGRTYLDRNLTFTPQTQPATPVDIRIYIKGSEYVALRDGINSMGQPSGIASINHVGLYKNEDNCMPAIHYLAYPVTTSGSQWGSSDYVLTASINSFSTFFIANKLFSVLPLRLLDFSAQWQGNATLLKWKTENEQNTDLFTIERSLNGTGFTVIGNINAANTGGQRNYNFTDNGISGFTADAVYYRLKMIDKDSRYTYSKVVQVRLNNNNDEVTVYPNPASNTITVIMPASWSGKQVTYSLISMTGKVLINKSFLNGGTAHQVSLDKLPAGNYILRILSETGTRSVMIRKI